MKSVISVTVVLLFGFAGNAYSALIDNGEYFFDDVTGYYWYTAVDDFKNQDWATAKTSVEALGTGGLTWELASATDLTTLDAYHIGNDILLASLMNLTNLSNSYTAGWASTESSPTRAYYYSASDTDSTWSFYTPLKTSSYKSVGAFAVAKEVEAEIPEPATMMLYGAGLLGATILRRRDRKNTSS